MPAAFLMFARVYPVPSSAVPPLAVRALLSVGAGLSLLSLTTGMIVHDVYLTSAGLSRKTGPVYPLFAAYFISTWFAGLCIFGLPWRHSRGRNRAQLQHLGTGLIIATVGGVSTNLILPLVTGNSSYSYFGPYFVLPLVLLVGHAIIRHRLLDLRLAIGRALGLTLLAGGVSVVALVLLQEFGASDRAQSVTRVPLGTVVLLVVTAVLFTTPFTPRLIRIFDSYMLRGRPDLNQALSDATRRLTRLLTPAEIAREIENTLFSSLIPEWVTVYLQPLDPLTGPTTSEAKPTVPLSREAVEQAAWALDTTAPSVQVITSPDEDDAASSRAEKTLHAAGVEVRIVLGRRAQPFGIVLLGGRKDGQAYFAPALQFLEELAELASRVMETAYLHHRHIAVERDRERLAHLERMGHSYAGLAHEIRTPLTTISNLVAGLSDRLDDAEFRDLLARLVPAEVARITSLADDLRALAPNTRLPLGLAPSRERVALHPLLDEVISLFASSVEGHGIKILLEGDSEPLPVLGYADRLKQLFHNLLRNATDASAPGSKIVIRLFGAENGTVVQVTDEGTGLDPLIRDRLFQPFVSTKTAGRGLGLSICLEIARAHGASLTLRNRESAHGAIAEITFPPLDATLSSTGTQHPDTLDPQEPKFSG